MKKTVLFVLVGVLCTAALFADRINTSEGLYVADILYQRVPSGTSGKEVAELTKTGKGGRWVTKFTQGQWQVIRQMLSHYETRKGEIYLIMFSREYNPMPTSVPGFYTMIVEFTSNTQYNWWCLGGVFNTRTEAYE
jgi:hypothetical protein